MTKSITIRDRKVVIYDYDLFLLLYADWRKSMSQEEVEDLLLACKDGE